MSNWKEYAYQLRKECPNSTWREIANVVRDEYPRDFTGDPFHQVRSSVRRRLDRERTNSIVCLPLPSVQTALSTHSEEQTEELITPESILRNNGLDSGLWKLNNYRAGGVSVKPISNGLSLEQIDSYFANKTFSSDKLSTSCYQYDASGEVLEIALPDLHAGLFSWRNETGEDYDVKIAKKRFFACINDIVLRCRYKKFKKIYFVTLGDLLHVDNNDQTTTKGTFQDTDGRFSKIFETTLDMLIDGITMLGAIAPVEVIYLCGNHDRLTGYMLLKATEKAFIADKNITFDVSPAPQKWRALGVNLIGWTHGDMPAKNMSTWLLSKARKELATTLFTEVHAGHLHHQKKNAKPFNAKDEDEDSGVIVRHLPTICSASYWENIMGFAGSEKTVMSFLWNEQNGLRDVWYSNI